MDVARPLRVISNETADSRLEKDADEALFLRVGKGDALAYRQLLARHGARQKAFAHRLLGNAADAEEVVQELFLRIWREAPRWQPGRAKFTTWLYKVMTNLCIDRKRRPPPPTVATVPDRPDEGPLADGLMAQQQEADRLRGYMAQLPERQRIAISLCYFEEMSNRDAADLLNLHLGALESLLSRGRATLKKLMLQDEEGVSDANA